MRTNHNVEDRLRRLEEDIDVQREKTHEDVSELVQRLKPASLAGEVQDAVSRQVDRVTDVVLDTVVDLADDTVGFLREHRLPVAAGAAAAVLAGVGVWYAARRQKREPVPIYAAYDFSEGAPDELPPADDAGTDKVWDRLKERTADAGQKAGEAYYAARSKAASLAQDVREKSHHAGDLARERADRSRELAARARDSAGEAGRWVQQQGRDNPGQSMMTAASLGLLIGLLLPARRQG